MDPRNEVNAARAALKKHPLQEVQPMCSSRDSHFREPTVAAAFYYAAGLMGDRLEAQTLAVKIERMHLHDGHLYVVMLEDLTTEEIDNLQQAWQEVAGAGRERVIVVGPDSHIWQEVWKKRTPTLAPQQAG